MQKYITILEEHKEELSHATRDINDPDGKMVHVFESLDYAIDSLKAVGESLKAEQIPFSCAELLNYINSKIECGPNTTKEEVLRQIEIAIIQYEIVEMLKENKEKQDGM